MKFFLNSKTSAHLRGLAEEFGESTNAVRLELNRLENAGMLDSRSEGNKKLFRANTKHPLYHEINAIVRKQLGIDMVVLNIIERLGDLERAYLVGPFANGENSPIIDLLLIGDLEVSYLTQLIAKAEKMIDRRIRYIHYTVDRWEDTLLEEFQGHPLLLWEKNKELV